MKQNDQHRKPAGRRKPYRRPEIRVYGNIRAITRSLGNTSLTADGGPMGSSKTR